MCEQNSNEQRLSIPIIILLGLAPGLIILFWAFVFSSPFFGINFSIVLSLMLAIILGLIPTELGILKYIAKKENKKIKDLILYKNKTPKLRMFLSIIISFIILGLAFSLISSYELKLWKIFDFVPDWFRLERANLQEMKYLQITVILTFIFNGFLGPIVEEIYFRGYLLPRMGVFGKFAPLMNSILFSLYHFFTPWQNITRIVACTPMVYSVWINKDIKIGIIVHCSGNLVGVVGMLQLLLSR
ncbi:MAG: CPBP family intramembrane metalloprotease [Fibromonadaceae bacterium]|nr:CPBP family intramembrane metalloprotease [Fibromonadaceae bacterium]